MLTRALELLPIDSFRARGSSYRLDSSISIVEGSTRPTSGLPSPTKLASSRL